MRHVRWGDNDTYFGPFTFSKSTNWRTLAIVLNSGGHGDDDDGPPYLRISIGLYSFIMVLPIMVPPQRRKVVAASWDAATVERMGRNWYFDVEPREYGFSYGDGFLIVYYGISPGDSSRDQTWGKHLPWTQWRHVRRSLYDLEGKHFWSELDSETQNYRRAAKLGSDLWRERYEIVRRWEEMCPMAHFKIVDHDGEVVTASTRLEQREWHFGTGWFKWLSLFRKPRIRSYLDISFSGETGPEKGSWKGGTTGTSIEMLPGELHEAAFRRYCDQDHRSKYRQYRVTFGGTVAGPAVAE